MNENILIIMTKVKITDKQDREKLSEGRNCGMGFAFLKKIKTNEFETVQPISPCKDYLNDVVYGEELGVDVSAYGLTYKGGQKIFDKKTSYMAAKILGYQKRNSSSNYQPLEQERKLFKENYKNIQHLLNWIEGKIGVKPLTTITEANEDAFLIKMPYYWSSQTYLISLYSLLLRMSLTYDGKISPKEFLNQPTVNFKMDQGLWSTAKPKLMLLLMGFKTTQKFDKARGGAIHNDGILAFNNYEICE